MESINMSGLKIDNMNGVDVIKAHANQTEIKEEDKDTSKDMLESVEPKAEEEHKQKHVVTYLGGSVFTDSTGHKWHKNDEQTYDDKEYDARSDIHFMVKYGEMKHIAVSI